MPGNFTYADLAYLEEMSMGSRKVLIDLIGLFLEQIPEYSQSFLSSMMNHDFPALYLAAHKARSSISALGMKELASDLGKLENLAVSGNEPASCHEIIHKFIDQVTVTSGELEDFIRSLPEEAAEP